MKCGKLKLLTMNNGTAVFNIRAAKSGSQFSFRSRLKCPGDGRGCNFKYLEMEKGKAKLKIADYIMIAIHKCCGLRNITLEFSWCRSGVIKFKQDCLSGKLFPIL